MSQENIFELIALVKSAKGDPSAPVDAVWDAGYRQPPRTEQEVAQITIDAFFYCDSYDMPANFWPRNYDDVLQNKLMWALLNEAEHAPTFYIGPASTAKRILATGFTKVSGNNAEKTEGAAVKALTKNVRLNALANSYAAAIHQHIISQNGGDFFYAQVDGEALKVDIIGGAAGVRQLIDACFLEAWKGAGKPQRWYCWISACWMEKQLRLKAFQCGKAWAPIWTPLQRTTGMHEHNIADLNDARVQARVRIDDGCDHTQGIVWQMSQKRYMRNGKSPVRPPAPQGSAVRTEPKKKPRKCGHRVVQLATGSV